MGHCDTGRLSEEQRRRLQELFEQQYGRMVRIARRALRQEGQADAEDIVQGIFLEAVVSCGNRPENVLGPGWLMRRLRSRIADQHRSRARQQRRVAAAAGLEPPRAVEDLADDRAAINELLAAIPDPGDRLTLALKLRGYREADIAALMSVPPGGRAVRDRLQRVRRQLQTWRAARSALSSSRAS
jgi:RNA polymerase sigma factor (sigma-70 family)